MKTDDVRKAAAPTIRKANAAAIVLALLAAWGLQFAATAPAAGGDALGPLDEGRRLFEQQFTPGKTPAGRGDGLGPVFNNISCVACHVQGGAGGGGPLDVNVQLLAAQLSGASARPPQKE